MYPMITANPEHDRAMMDIYLESLPPDESKYPLCDICGERILPGQKYTELGEETYIHKDCMKYVRWRAMDDKGIF